MLVAVRLELPPADREAMLLESTATPQCRLAPALPFSHIAEASVPITPSSTLVPASASTHRSETFAAACEVACAEARGALARKRLVNQRGWSWSTRTVNDTSLERQLTVTVAFWP